MLLAPVKKDDGRFDSWLGLFHADGSPAWERRFGSDNVSASVWDVVEAHDGRFVLVGARETSRDEGWDAWYICLSADGRAVWDRSFGGASPDVLKELVDDGHGGYVAAGETDSFGAGGQDILLVGFRPDGELSWARTHGGAGFEGYGTGGPSLSPDGGFVVSPNTHSTGTSANLWLIRTDVTGHVLGERSHSTWEFGEITIER